MRVAVVVVPALIFTMRNNLIEAFTDDIERLVVNNDYNSFFSRWSAYIHIWTALRELCEAINLCLGEYV